ncbi:MAG: hypothetical protein KDA65_00615 [Planctomycetaceae bacterium]|nr:hypothetical protein [Planctomycetaceae bacterium]
MGRFIETKERQVIQPVALFLRDEEGESSADSPAKPTANEILPDLDSGPAEEVWRKYFQEERSLTTISKVVQKLVRQQAHEHVIAAIQQALLAGYSQPWMYEVLAFSMRASDYPQDQIDRVLLSTVDFQASDVPHLLVSAAYLSRLDAKQAALKMYKQAAELLPTQVEAYALGLGVAEELKDEESIAWAANGILVNGLGDQYKSRRIQAEAAFRKIIETTKESDSSQSQEFERQLSNALTQDLRVKVTWVGSADFDLTVVEPGGMVCSLHQPQTINGGQFLHDGFGPDKENCYEEYVASQATPGIYQLQIQHVRGDAVGNRFRVTIWRRAGGVDETVQEINLSVKSDEQTIQLNLPFGRRIALLKTHELSRAVPRRGLSVAEAKRLKREQRNVIPVSSSNRPVNINPLFQQGNTGTITTGTPGGTAVGYQPVVTSLAEGVSLTAMAVVSADRRYVRISTRPVFSNITDVFTFGVVQQGP